MAADDMYFSFKFREKPYKILNSDMTNQRLKQLKQWFGREYGSFTGFPNLVIRDFDADAWAGMIWIGQQVAGEPADDPRTMEFTLDDIELWVDESEETEPDPLDKPEGGTEPPTLALTGTASTSSEESTSSDSQTSAE